MISVLPRVFSPNRLFGRASAPTTAGVSSDDMASVAWALQGAAWANLRALLSGEDPVPMQADGLAPFIAKRSKGRRAKRYSDPSHSSLSATPPSEGLVASLLREPERLETLTRPGPHFGAEILLPMILRHAFGDAVFRHGIADTCRRFLSDRVLFHPGPPPQPDFSISGICLLVASQPGHIIGSEYFSLLRAAAAEVAEPYGPWDQWLLRMMARTDWDVPPDLEQLPWVAWTTGDDMDEADIAAAGLPLYWASVLELAP